MLPGEKIRSLTFADARNIADSKAGAGIGGLPTAGLAGAAAGAFRTYSLLKLDSPVSLSSDVSQAQVTKVMRPGSVSMRTGCPEPGFVSAGAGKWALEMPNVARKR